jgi:lipopolysaccharide export system permease protein
MIFQRTLIREVAGSASAIFVVLFSIVAATQTIRLLRRATAGVLDPQAVLALLGFGMLRQLALILTLTLFVAVLMALSRQYRDSEMVVWFSSGRSLVDWIWPIMGFALPILLIVTWNSLYLTPWAARQSEVYLDRIENKDDDERITPGAFAESSRTDRVFFVEGIAEKGDSVRNVFVSTFEKDKQVVLVAQSGYRRVEDNGDRYLVLNNGRRYEGTPGKADFHIMEFVQYALRVKDKEERPPDEITAKQLRTRELLAAPSPTKMGELLWRIGVPILAVMLTLLAIPLSYVNPRAGRTTNLIFALLTYLVYNNCVSIAQAWVASGRSQFWPAWWVVHAVVGVLLVLLFMRRMRNRPLWQWG